MAGEYTGVQVNEGVGPGIAFKPTGDGLKAQAVALDFGTSGQSRPASDADPFPIKDETAQAKLDLIVAALSSLLNELQTKTKPTDTQQVALPPGASTDGGQLRVDMRLSFLMGVFSRMSFAGGSLLRCDLASTTLPTVTAVTTGYMSLGDIGKPATAQLASQQNFQTGAGRNFVRT